MKEYKYIFIFIKRHNELRYVPLHLHCILYCTIYLLQRACNLKTSVAQCHSVGEMRLIYVDLMVEWKQKSVILCNYTDVVCFLFARVMLCGSNSRKVNHRWGMVVRLACGGQQGVWHHLILCVSKRSVDCVCLCCMLYAFVFSWTLAWWDWAW